MHYAAHRTADRAGSSVKRATYCAYGVVQCATHCATYGADGFVQRLACCAAHRADYAVHYAPHRTAKIAQGAVMQASKTERAGLRTRDGPARKLQVAIGHHVLATRALHAHLAGDACIERRRDRAIMGLARQFFLGGQAYRCGCRGLALALDSMSGDGQMRVGVAVDAGLQPGQSLRGRRDTRCRLGAGTHRCQRGTRDADPGLCLRIGRQPQRRSGTGGNVRCQ